MNEKHVAVLMATYNGEEFIEQQLLSLSDQTHRNFSIWVSDDRSSDATLAIIRSFAERSPQFPVTVVEGPARGFVQNFLSLVCHSGIEADYFAFCDQDDIWHRKKLEVAVATLDALPSGRPGVYFSRTHIVDRSGHHVGYSPLFSRQPTLHNALVQSIGGGNTMVLNRDGRALLQAAGHDVDVPSHDWWAYLAITACDGTAFYDQNPYIDYRQHSGNIIGENSSLGARFVRVGLLLEGRFSSWIAANLRALDRLRHRIPASNQVLIDRMNELRAERSTFSRFRSLRHLGLYRQTKFGDASLLTAVLLRKL